MAKNGQSSSQADAGPSGEPKAIGSLAKKSSDVTRQGTQKLKFVPTLPARRKKEEVKQEAPPSSISPPAERGNGRGRGRGRGRGGEGRGAAPRPPPVEMTASGPFAMGPALAGTSARRTAPQSNYTPVVARPSANPSADKGQLKAPMPTLQQSKPLKSESDEEVYSEPDEGVEIIDMDNVRQLDWMAPETLEKDRRPKKKRVKTETEGVFPSGLNSEEPSSSTVTKDRSGDPSNALNLSESEEELEDLIEDFATQTDVDQEEDIRQGRLYFFQFPEPFPTFVSVSASELSSVMDVDSSEPGPSTLTRKVSFAADAKPPAPTSGSATPSEVPKETPKVDGIIGQLEVYRSGAVKMRLGNGIVLHLSEGTQPSFLQQAVHLDTENKKLCVLGEVTKRYVVSPDLETLLTSMELEDQKGAATALDNANLIQMDTS